MAQSKTVVNGLICIQMNLSKIKHEQNLDFIFAVLQQFSKRGW